MPIDSPTDTSTTLFDHLRNLPQYLLPQRLLTRLTWRITRIQIPWLKNALIRGFVRQFQVNLDEAVESEATAYPDFNTFFTRPLKPDARPLASGNQAICCPVDGTISQIGTADADTLLQAKGRHFSVTTLLGGDVEWARPFHDGNFATLYLSPRDYHRIHMPLAGQLRQMVHIPGKLFSVSPLTTRVVPELFARNERVVTLFDTPAGAMALVLVGAINVASIETVWAGAITPPLGTKIRCWDYPQTGNGSIQLDKGVEMGRFNMGSTVIVLFSQGVMRWASGQRADTTVRMGQELGVRTP